MATAGGGLAAVICEDDPVVATALVDTLSGLFGFAVSAVVETSEETLTSVGALAPELVVIDLALAGERGIGVISALIEASPATAVVAVIPGGFGALRADAREAGALELVELTDLRPLRRCLERVHAAAHGASCPNCPSCPSCPATRPPATAAALDATRSRVDIDSGAVSLARLQPPGTGAASPPPA